MVKTEQIGGVWFKVVTEYEQKFLYFNDARFPWSEVQKLMTFVSEADAEKFVEPVVAKVEPVVEPIATKIVVAPDAPLAEVSRETPVEPVEAVKPKKARKPKK